MHTRAVPGDRLGGGDRPERLVPLRMPAVASAATGSPRRCGNSLPTDSSTRPHRPADPIGGTAWFSERLPIRVWGSETLSCRLTCNVIAEPVAVGHRHIGSTGTCGPDGPTAGVADLRVRPRYTAGIRKVHLASSCRVTDQARLRIVSIAEATSGPAFRTAGSALPGGGDDLLRIGLDLSGSAFAPCLLGCPGTTR
jgi:hypothetical protein